MKPFIFYLGIPQIIPCRKLCVHADDKHHVFQGPVDLIAVIAEKIILQSPDIRAEFLVFHIVKQIISHGLCLHENRLRIELLPLSGIWLISIPHAIDLIPVAEICTLLLKFIGILQIAFLILRCPKRAFLCQEQIIVQIIALLLHAFQIIPGTKEIIGSNIGKLQNILADKRCQKEHGHCKNDCKKGMKEHSRYFHSVTVGSFLHKDAPLVLVNLIAHAPDYLEVARLFRVDLDLLADMADMNRHRIVRTDRILVPDALIDLVDRKYLPLILHKEKQNVVFNRRQLNRLPVHRDLF